MQFSPQKLFHTAYKYVYAAFPYQISHFCYYHQTESNDKDLRVAAMLSFYILAKYLKGPRLNTV